MNDECQGHEKSICALDSATRWDLVRQHGNFTIAYSTACQPGLKYFGDSRGYIAYNQSWGYSFALGDPVAPRKLIPSLIHSFLQRHHKPCWVHISKPTAQHLASRGYYVNQMGIDTWLELIQYNFDGKSKERIRYAANWLARRGYQVKELGFDEISPGEVVALSEQWRRTRPVKRREVRFLNRPLPLHDEPDVRKFFLIDRNNRLQAFVYFDPIYSDRQIIGYSTVIKRRLPKATAHAELGIMKAAVESFKREGVQSLRLGLSPLANINDRSFKRNPILHHCWSYGFRARWVNRYLYNAAGLTRFKRRFRGIEHPVYFATPVLISEFRIVALLRMAGVLENPLARIAYR